MERQRQATGSGQVVQIQPGKHTIEKMATPLGVPGLRAKAGPRPCAWPRQGRIDALHGLGFNPRNPNNARTFMSRNSTLVRIDANCRVQKRVIAQSRWGAQPVELEVSHSLLAGHVQSHAVVAGWLRSEWPSWYGPGGSGNADDDVRRYSQVDQLPLGLLAFARGTPCAFGVLKQDAVPGFEHAEPWLGAGYVIPSLRGQGVGLGLIHALEAEASRLGFAGVYCATSTALSLMERAGWSHAGVSLLGGKQVAIYQNAP